MYIHIISLSVNGVMDYEELYDLQDEEDNEDVIDFFS